jgi:hypothetical protein
VGRSASREKSLLLANTIGCLLENWRASQGGMKRKIADARRQRALHKTLGHKSPMCANMHGNFQINLVLRGLSNHLLRSWEGYWETFPYYQALGHTVSS